MSDGQVENIKNQWWRWPLLPFASFVGATLGATLFTAIQWLGMKMTGGFSEDGWFFLYVLPVISSAAFGWLYAWITCYVAPAGKVIAGVVMVTVLALLSILGLAIAWHWNEYPTIENVRTTLATIAMLVAAIAALVQIHSEQR